MSTWSTKTEKSDAGEVEKISPPRVCRAVGCHRPADYLAARLCKAHYFRLRRTGTLGEDPIRPRRDACSIPGCDRQHAALGLCGTHYTRWRRYGTTDLLGGPPPLAGPANPRWVGDDVGYHGAHRRVRALRGPAANYPCDRCRQRPARHWALVHGSARERTDPGTRLPYSPNPDDYRPLCVRCHKHTDLGQIAHSVTAWLW